jgi:hypothetical protein
LWGLYAVVLPHRFREIIIIVLFSVAALDGLVGILQYFDLITAIPAVFVMLQELGYPYSEHLRPSGFTLVATTYAAKLAFALGCAVLLLFHGRRRFLATKAGSLFLMMVVLLIAGGMIVSHSRGPLLAFIISVSITVFFHNWKRLVFCAVSLIIIITIVSTARPQVECGPGYPQFLNRRTAAEFAWSSEAHYTFQKIADFRGSDPRF